MAGCSAVRRLAGVLLALLVAGCAASGPDGRMFAEELADARHFLPLRLEAGDFVLRGWLREGRGTLHVYIEGDGHAWETATRLSGDPTPHRPTGFLLAAADDSSCPVLYLARPCQYVEGADRRNCRDAVWADERYGDRVVRSLDAAISTVMRRVHAGDVALYGFSGGGALAALLTERRKDVVFLCTVAANLDTDAWVRHHGLRPLAGSLNPARRKAETAAVPQRHAAGSEDQVCPPFLAADWCRGLPDCTVTVVPGMAHGGAWEDVWPAMLAGKAPEAGHSGR